MPDAESRLVMDANVFVHAYQTVDAPTIRARLASWQAADVVFHVPTLWRYEMTNALCRNIKAGLTSIQRGDETLSKILDLPVEYHDERELHEEATAIALRLNAGAAYDAHYLALALRLNVPFYDRRRQA